MQIRADTIIWNQPSTDPNVVSKAVPKSSFHNEVFRLQKMSGEQINGSMPVWGAPQDAEENVTASLAQAGQDAKISGQPPKMASALADTGKAEDTSFGFLDFVDMINPLQHIPIVSTIYRDLTGDTIKPVSRVIGGAAFGGPIGAAAGIVNALVQIQTGRDVGDNMLASIEGPTSAVPPPANPASSKTHLYQRAYNS